MLTYGALYPINDVDHLYLGKRKGGSSCIGSKECIKGCETS